MSVEHKTIIIVGITEERFFELFPALHFIDNEEEFVDEFYIHANYWCSGQRFIGQYVSELDEGEFITIENLTDNFYIEDKKKKLRVFNISLDEIKTFIINQVF